MLFLQSWLQGMEAVACMFWSGQLGLKMKKKKEKKGGKKKKQTKIQFGFAVTGEFLCWALAPTGSEGQIWQGGLQIFYVVLLTPLTKRMFFLPPPKENSLFPPPPACNPDPPGPAGASLTQTLSQGRCRGFLCATLPAPGASAAALLT